VVGCSTGKSAGLAPRRILSTNETVETPAVRERLGSLGVVVPGAERRTSDYRVKFVAAELARWAVPIKASGVSAD
jgi:hypothetical protein